MSKSNSGKSMPETDAKYEEALRLYRTTELPTTEICRQTNVALNGFKQYLYRCHRELMFARHGIHISADEALVTKLKKSKGQTKAARAKYGDAILACDDEEYIEFNVSQIANIFHVCPSCLTQQLRRHFPEIVERREKARANLGLKDSYHRGARRNVKEQYAEAVDHLKNSDDTIRQAAELYSLSYSGLRGHLLYYHKELVEKREGRRISAKGSKQVGRLTGNGTKHLPTEAQIEKYEEALRMYRETALTIKEIVASLGIPSNGFRNYVRMWHRGLILERRGVAADDKEATIANTKHYLKSTAAKYAEAIEFLRTSKSGTADAAKRFGLHPDCFREYLQEHEPELATSLGMTRLENGRTVLARSAEKYGEAIRIYETSTETMRSIALRLGITYNSLNGYVRRNHPDIIEKHKALVEAEARKSEGS